MTVVRPDRPPVASPPGLFDCPKLPGVDVCSVVLPGGYDFADVDLLKSIQPAISPLVPIFNLVEALVAVKACVEAATEMPDPTALLECIPGLTEAIQKLLGLLPQASVPKMVLDLIDCVTAELQRLRAFVLGLLSELDRIATVIEKAAELEDPNLNGFAICASERLAAQLDDKLKALIVLGRLLGAMRGLLELIGVDPELVPDFSDISGAALEEIQEPLDSAIEALQTLRDLIPA